MLHKLSFAFLFAVLTCGQITSAQVTVQDKCPAVKLLENFDWNHFGGIWFEYARLEDNLEGKWVCVVSNYLILDNDIEVHISGLNLPHKTVPLDAAGKVLGPGLFFVTFNGSGQKRFGQILGTDYNSWAVIFSCEEGNNEHTENAVILTRERDPNPDAVNRAREVWKQNNISTYHLHETKPKDCPTLIAKGNIKTNLRGSIKNRLLP